MKSLLKFSDLFKCIFILTILLLNGCACVTLSDWNKQFEEDHQRAIEFAASSVPATYLGKFNEVYVYEVTDLNNQKVIFRLPAKKDKKVEITLDDHRSYTRPGKPATFYFNNKDVILDTGSDFPQTVAVYTASLQTGFSYSCKDGEFHNEIDKSIKEGIKCGELHQNCHGLSMFDSSILGLRRTGYLVTATLDIASLPLVIPFAVIFAFGWCGPFGCP
ncbi:hypothetical protein [Geobacter sp.]|uniref:hypothetical protein n=1 Tax=Geobacter sp. TaxID=46610 RepID=UPI001AC3B628|nr:hypothetical protein [Geobacter sp.]CAG0958114.1 hypothetical protein ANRL3_00688 [Anaerolineae bacterium]